MSLHNAAQHLAAQGRNTDSMLVHMTPREVAGLQALAEHHGTSLTINPDTGLPEAFSLKDFLPAAAGFALNAFLPGVGTAIGTALGGLSGAAGSAIAIGGLAGLSSGSLADGIKAGMGAYGGAGLASGLMGLADTGNLAQTAADADMAGGLIPAGADGSAALSASTAPTDVLSKLQAGAGAAMEAPKDFLKDQSGNLFKALGPAVLGSLTPETGTMPTQTSPGYIRQYEKDPVTGALYQVSATPTSEWGGRSAVTFGGVPQRTGYAGGGTVNPDPLSHFVWNPDTKKYDTVSSAGTVKPAATGPVTFGGVAKSTRVNDPNDTRTDSQKAYDYLMGVPGAKNPMLFTHQQPEKQAVVPLDMYTRTGGHYNYNTETGAYDWVADTAAGGTDVVSKVVTDSSGGGEGGGVGGSTGTNDGTGPGLATMGMNGIASLADAMGLTGPTVGPDEGLAPVSNLGTAIGAFSLPDDAVAVNDQTMESVNMGQTQAEAQQAAQAAEALSNEGIGVGTIGAGQAADGGGTTGAMGGGFGSGVSTGQGNVGVEGNVGLGLDGIGGEGQGGGGGGGGNDGNGASGSGTGIGGIGSNYAYGGITALAGGGLGSLGGYSDGGQLLKGPGDGVSDSIPATIGRGQPARLADGEFVVPARIVSELGNGSTEAGAKQLYAMMARIQAGRAKTIGKNKVAKNSKAARHLPA